MLRKEDQQMKKDDNKPKRRSKNLIVNLKKEYVFSEKPLVMAELVGEHYTFLIYSGPYFLSKSCVGLLASFARVYDVEKKLGDFDLPVDSTDTWIFKKVLKEDFYPLWQRLEMALTQFHAFVGDGFAGNMWDLQKKFKEDE